MKTVLLYALRCVFKPKLSNLFKILTLMLGIAIGGLLLSKATTALNINKWIPNHQNTNFLMLDISVGEEDYGFSEYSMGPMAAGLRNYIPEVEAATHTQFRGSFNYSKTEGVMGDIGIETYAVDSSFFKVIDFQILSGATEGIFLEKNDIALSESSAEKIFGVTTGIIGKTVYLDKSPYTLKAVYKDLPRNSIFETYNAIVKGVARKEWLSGSGYITYFTTHPNIDSEDLDRKINEAFAPHMKEALEEGYEINFFAKNIIELPDYQIGNNQMNNILMIVAVLILIMSATNFILLEINSLVARGKEVGIHKSNGATPSEIFNLIIVETLLYLLISTMVAGLLLFALRQPIESLIGSYEDIFSISSVWVIIGMLLILLLCAGAVPGYIFAKITVLSVLQNSVSQRQWWKKIFVTFQFTLSIAVICVLIALSMQYKMVSNFDVGYDYEKLAYVSGIDKINHQKRLTLKEELVKLPYVQSASLTSNVIDGEWNSQGVWDKDGKTLLTAQFMLADEDFFETFGVEILKGDLSAFTWGRVFVNQVLLDMTQSEFGDGKIIVEGSDPAGVINNFYHTLYKDVEPTMIICGNWAQSANLTLRSSTDKFTKEQIQEIETMAKEIIGLNDVEAYSVTDYIKVIYAEIYQARTYISFGALILIIITILGTLSYIKADINNRRREIVVRRVHGSAVRSIIALIAKRVIILASISSLIAIPIAIYTINAVLALFVQRIDVSWWIFALGVIAIMFTVIVSTTLLAWKLASRDYVRLIGKV